MQHILRHRVHGFVRHGLLGIACMLAVDTAQAVKPAPAPEAGSFREALLASPELEQRNWASFYREREAYWVATEAAWLGGIKLTAEGVALLEALQQAETHGLRAEDYRLSKIKGLTKGFSARTADQLAAEMLLMRGYLDFYQHLAEGRYPELMAESQWHIPQQDYNEAEAFQRLQKLGVAQALQAVLPTLPEYALLRQARRNMLNLVQAGGWPTVPAGDLLKPGMHSEQLPALRKRLQVEGFLAKGASSAEPNLFDEATVAALKGFQQRYGLQEDSILGPAGRAMLNLPAEVRLAQIDANLERLRWLPQQLADNRLAVNIPGFNLRGYRSGEELINMRVVVGEVENQTPTFTDVLEYIEINPYWSIPNSIVVNELAPKLVRNVNYLEARRMQVYEGWEDDDTIDADDIDWEDYTDPEALFPHVIKQDPGPWNALGRIKFMFPNQYSIYLHDTPETELFWAADRSFSHGCVRVHKPMAVADFILRNTEDWDMPRVRETLEDRDNTRVDLDKGDRLRVYLYYFTAWADEQGELHFRPDIYQRDEELISRFRR